MGVFSLDLTKPVVMVAHCDSVAELSRQVEQFGCDKVYTLDGGNTGSIVMNGKLINRTTFGYERWQGDLLYFCTAIPNPNETETQGNP